MNAFKMNKNTKTGRSAGTVHQNTMGGSSHMKGISPTSAGPLSSFYSGGPVLSLKGLVQPKLTIGQPNDRYEREADRVADQVMRMPEPKQSSVNGHSSLVQRQSTCSECPEKEDIQAKPAASQITPLVQRQEEEEEEEEPVQAKQFPNKSPPVNTGLQSRIRSLSGSGQPLSKSVRGYYEPRFGADFSQVRVHTGTQAAETAKSINARAFTTGRDVIFAVGQYSPGTLTGKRLLAHELTHVLQQNISRQRCQFLLQRQPVQVRSGRFVGGGRSNNLREEVLHVMDRLHTLWSMSNPEYNAEYPRVSALSPGSRVPPANIPNTIVALRRSRVPTMNPTVARHFLNLTFSANVGRGQTNNRADIITLQTVLYAHGFLVNPHFTTERAAVVASTSARIPDSVIQRTIVAITSLKVAIVGGRIGWLPIRADEQEYGGDRFGGRTFEFRIFSIFIPRGVRPGRNKVHIFFSPGDVQGSTGFNAVLTHGLRGASDSSEWILIGVPGKQPGYNSISTTQITDCLTRIGRSGPISALRFSAHSRGYRGLRETIRRRLVNTALVDRVVVLDANYGTIARVLSRSGIPRNRIIAYGVVTGNLAVRGGRNIRLNPRCMRAVGYSRLIKDAMVTRPSLAIPPRIRRQLLPLPNRGCFTTKRTGLSGCQVNINSFCTRNRAAVNTIIRQENHRVNGLKRFIDSNNLVRFGRVFSANIYSHHFFVAEIAHEITD